MVSVVSSMPFLFTSLTTGGAAGAPLVAVTGGAVVGEDRSALIGRAAARRQARAIRLDIDVPFREIGGTDRLAEVWALRQRCAATERQGQESRQQESFMHR